MKLGKVSGKYKGKNFTILIDENWYDCRIFCNDKEIKSVRKAVITVEAGQPTTINLEIEEASWEYK